MTTTVILMPTETASSAPTFPSNSAGSSATTHFASSNSSGSDTINTNDEDDAVRRQEPVESWNQQSMTAIPQEEEKRQLQQQSICPHTPDQEDAASCEQTLSSASSLPEESIGILVTINPGTPPVKRVGKRNGLSSSASSSDEEEEVQQQQLHALPMMPRKLNKVHFAFNNHNGDQLSIEIIPEQKSALRFGYETHRRWYQHRDYSRFRRDIEFTVIEYRKLKKNKLKSFFLSSFQNNDDIMVINNNKTKKSITTTLRGIESLCDPHTTNNSNNERNQLYHALLYSPKTKKRENNDHNRQISLSYSKNARQRALLLGLKDAKSVVKDNANDNNAVNGSNPATNSKRKGMMRYRNRTV